ncbi:MAG: hypothetical protein LIO44_02590 [Eubacterium sp.]|nr:hypothetical protein [Eubacterium sp.]
MMKSVKIVLITALLILAAVFSVTAQAADKEVYEFSRIKEYNGEIYEDPGMFYMLDQKVVGGNVSVNKLPYALRSQFEPLNDNAEDCLISFCIYNDKIYYNAGPPATMDGSPSSIYFCDLDGTNNVLLAENAHIYGAIYIVDNFLYYSSLRPYRYYPHTDGGIYKINLSDFSVSTIVQPSDTEGNGANLLYCDGENVYYEYIVPSIPNSYFSSCVEGYYKVDINGYNTVEITETEADFYKFNNGFKGIFGDMRYYIEENVMYEKNKDGSIIRKIYDNITGENPLVTIVTNDYIYYTVRLDGNRYLYRVERQSITVYLNDEKIEFEKNPIRQDGNILVPIREIGEAMGKTVLWSSEYQAAFIDNTDNALIIPIGETNLYLGDEQPYSTWEKKPTKVPSQVIDGSTLVPIRQFAEALGAEVNWVNEEQAAYITYTDTKGSSMSDELFEAVNLNYYIGRYETNPFSEYTEIIDSFYNDRDKAADAVIMGLSSMFDVPSDLWSMLLYDETNASMAIQQALYDIISEIPDGISEVTIDTSLEKDIMSWIETGKKVYDKANGIDDDFLEAHKNLKYLDSTISSLSDLFDFTVFSAEEIAYILSDYSEGIAYIDAFETAMSNSGALNSNAEMAIRELKRQYTKEYYQVIKDAHSEVINKTFSEALKAILGKEFAYTYSISKFVLKEIIFKATGISSKGSALETFYSIYSFNAALDKCFDSSIKAAKTSVDLSQIKALFAFEIAEKKTAFSCMKNFSDWWAADTYNAMLDSLTYYVWDNGSSDDEINSIISGYNDGGGGSW